MDLSLSMITPPCTLFPFSKTLPPSVRWQPSKMHSLRPSKMLSLRCQASEKDSVIIPPQSPSNFSSPLRVSKEMKEFLHGRSHMSRNDVMKYVWGYINHNKLMAPYYKTFDITLDEELTRLMGHRVQVPADDIKGLLLRHFPTKYDELFPVPTQLTPLVGYIKFISISMVSARITYYIKINKLKVRDDGTVICDQYLSSILQDRTEVMQHEIPSLVCVNFPMLYTVPLPVSQELFYFCEKRLSLSINEAAAAVYHYAKENCLMGPSYKMVKVIFDDQLKELFDTKQAEFNEIPTLIAKHFII